MVEQLFGSKTRVKLLKLFFSNPNRSFYVREITRKIDEQINSVRRELSNLLSIGIITSDTSNNRLYYEVNQKYEYYKPLGQIFGQSKGTGTVKTTTKKDDPYKELGSLEVLVLTGSFTRDSRAGVDILFIGELNPNSVARYVSGMEEQEGRDLTYAVLTKDEYSYRKQIKDRFISDILSSKVSVLHDPHQMITKE